MTDEQIYELAKNKALDIQKYIIDGNVDIDSFAKDCCLAGAHSRDEEVKQWKESKCRLRLRLMQIIHELRNPWISVEKRLPEENSVVFVSLNGTEYLSAHYRAKSKRFVTVSKDKQTLVEVRKSSATYVVCGDCIKEERLYSEGQREDITSLVTHWMPIQQIEKGDEK